jgi:hypothetical protein
MDSVLHSFYSPANPLLGKMIFKSTETAVYLLGMANCLPAKEPAFFKGYPVQFRLSYVALKPSLIQQDRFGAVLGSCIVSRLDISCIAHPYALLFHGDERGGEDAGQGDQVRADEASAYMP